MAKTTKKKSAASSTKAATSRRRRYRILSCDGGGIRGVMSAVWLAALEKELGGPLADYFDLVAGTSTGSILAAGVAMRTPAKRMVALYQEHGREIFPSTASRLWNRLGRSLTQGPSAPKYSDAGLASVLQGEFRDATLGTLPEDLTATPPVRAPLLLVVTYNVLTRQSLVLKSRRADYAGLALWEVLKASCSAPTYFPAHVMNLHGASVPLIDGGVVANNPAACAIAEGVRVNAGKDHAEPCELEDFVVASLGTGQATRSISISEAREWGALEWAVPVIDVLFDGAADATDYVASYLIPEAQYFRFQTSLDEAYDDLDNADLTNVNALVAVANRHLASEGGADRLTKLAKMLRG